MDIVTAAQFDRDLSKNLSGLPVHCGFEAEFASALPHARIPTILKAFLKDPEKTDIEGIPPKEGPCPGIIIQNSYGASHGGEYKSWSVETDSTIHVDNHHSYRIELVSPILTLPDMIHGLKAVMAMLRSNVELPQEYVDSGIVSLGKTDKETGCHLTFSIKDIDLSKVDVLKLAVLLGENHWGDVFDRHNTGWAEEALDHFKNWIREKDVKDPGDLAATISDFINLSFHDAADSSFSIWITDDIEKYRSINMSKTRAGVIEFRLPGGKDYQYKADKLAIVAERFAYAFYASADATAYADYYKQKLVRIALKFLATPEAQQGRATWVTDESTVHVRIRSTGGSTYLCFMLDGKPLSAPVMAFTLNALGDGAYEIAQDVPEQQSFRSITGAVNLVKTNSISGYVSYSLIDPKFKLSDTIVFSLLQSFLVPRSVPDTRSVQHYVYLRYVGISEVSASKLATITIDTDWPDSLKETIQKEKDANSEWLSPKGSLDLDRLVSTIQNSKAQGILKLHAQYKDQLNTLIYDDSKTVRLDKLAGDPLAKDKFDLSRTVEEPASVVADYLGSSEYQRDIGASWGERFNGQYLSPFNVPKNLAQLGASFLDRMKTHYWLFAECFPGTRNSYAEDITEEDFSFFLEVLALLPEEKKESLADTVCAYVATHLSSAVYPDGFSDDRYVKELHVLIEHVSDINNTEDTANPVLPDVLSRVSDIITSQLDRVAANKISSLLTVIFPKLPNFVKYIETLHAHNMVENLESNSDVAVGVGTDLLLNGQNTGFASKLPRLTIKLYLSKIAAKLESVQAYTAADVSTVATAFVLAYAQGIVDSIPKQLDSTVVAQAAVHCVLNMQSATELDSDVELNTKLTAFIEQGTKLLSIAPKLKSELYRSYLHDLATETEESLKEKGALALASLISIGYSTYGAQALGAGSTTFFNTALKRYRGAWTSSVTDDFLHHLDALCHLSRPLPTCPLFDSISKLLSTYPTAGDPAADSSRGMFTNYQLDSTKVGTQKDLIVTYPKMHIELSEVPVMPYPDDFAAQYRLTPKQLAAFFGSPSGEAIDPASLTPLPFKTSHLLITNLNAYTVMQLDELYSCPSPNAKAKSFGDSLAQTIFSATKSGPCPASLLSSNVARAYMVSSAPGMSTFLLQYVESVLIPDDDFRRYNMFTGGEYNLASGSSLFSSLLPFYATATVGISRQHVSFANIIQAFYDDHVLTPEAFCSKELVSFYRFCVRTGIADKASSSILPEDLLNIYTDLGLHTQAAIIDALVHEYTKAGHAAKSLFPDYGYPYYGN